MAIIRAAEPSTFDFQADGSSSEFRVVRFSGLEEISGCFHFEIDLVSADADVDFDAILQGKASLSIHWDGNVRKFEGVLRSFEQLDKQLSNVNYHAVLVPRLWQLALTHQSRIFQDETVPQILGEVLKQHGLTENTDYQLKLKKSYPKREYVVQYQETDLNFVSRWLEHEGIFYFFKDEKLIFADDKSVHEPISPESEIAYHSPTGLEPVGLESVQALVCRQRSVPGQVTLKDYNWRKPSLDLKVQPKAPDAANSTFMEYGDHYKETTDEGTRLAQVRSEEFQCRERLIMGESDCRGFAAGFKYELSKHYREDLNQEYLLVEVTHFGSQSGAAADGGGDQAPPNSSDYRNQFVSIPAKVAFRPERATPKPKMLGAMNAKIDAAGSGEFAEIDEKGRYKVIMPFDLSGKGGGKASRYIRMAQPYAGPDYGIHFPLHKGVEVIWACIDGDPDRPIICGAVPNPETCSPVTSENHTKSVVRDYGGNEIVLEGATGKQQICLFSPTHNTSITLGNSIAEYTESEISLRSAKDQVYVKADTQITLEVGASSLVLKQDGTITLKGVRVTVEGSALTELHGGITDIKGTLVKINT